MLDSHNCIKSITGNYSKLGGNYRVEKLDLSSYQIYRDNGIFLSLVPTLVERLPQNIPREIQYRAKREMGENAELYLVYLVFLFLASKQVLKFRHTPSILIGSFKTFSMTFLGFKLCDPLQYLSVLDKNV